MESLFEWYYISYQGSVRAAQVSPVHDVIFPLHLLELCERATPIFVDTLNALTRLAFNLHAFVKSEKKKKPKLQKYTHFCFYFGPR